MNIRLKLIFLILIVTLAFLSSFTIYFIITNPIVKIENEQQSLETLLSALNSMALEVTKIDKDPINTQMKIINEKVVLLKEEFDKIKGLKVLPKSNLRVQASLSSIENLQTLIYMQIEDLQNKVNSLSNDAEDLFGSSENISVLDFYEYYVKKGREKISQETIHFNIKFLYSQITVVIKNIGYSVKTVEEQFNVIRNEIARIRYNSLLITIIIIAIIVAAALIFSFNISLNISKSVQTIDGNILLLKGGDLTAYFKIKSRDDLGRLSNNLNTFLTGLSSAIDEIKNISQQNFEVKEDLLNVANQTSTSLTEIAANIEAIKKEISILDDNIHISSSSSENIFKSIDTLNNQLMEQNSMVEETSSSVAEMITSIDNVAKITNNRKSSTDHLVKTAKDGGEKLSDTVNIIAEINQSLDNIRGTTEIIQKIAVQTNLLAMNAAIEAAHAGEAGHGFSVVAQEIRNLSEATTVQSKQISVNLKKIIERIEKASKSSEITNDAYNQIHQEINEVNTSFLEIYNSMNELMIGGKQILEAMEHLREVSIHVKDASKEISSNSTETLDSIVRVKDISSSVRTNILDISSEIGEISNATNKANNLTEKLSHIIENLNKQVSHFKTKEEKSK